MRIEILREYDQVEALDADLDKEEWRRLFAMAAMNALLSPHVPAPMERLDGLAKQAFKVADAMLKELE